MNFQNYTVDEAAELAKVSRVTLYAEVKKQRLRIMKCGRRTLISEGALLDWQRILEREAEDVAAKVAA